MATNKPGRGTVNVAVNLLSEERAIWAKLAIADERSLGDFIRRVAIAGLRITNPAAAEQIEAVRKLHREQMLMKL